MARAQTSKHVGIYNDKSAQRCALHDFIDLNIFVRTQILRFGRRQCFREGFTQSFINEAPGPGEVLISALHVCSGPPGTPVSNQDTPTPPQRSDPRRIAGPGDLTS